MAEDLAKIAMNLEKSGQPLWLWEPRRRRIIWTNRAGREFWGAQSLFDLAARSFALQGAEARAMAKTGNGLEALLNLPGGRVSAVLDIAEITLPELGEARLVRLSRINQPPRIAPRAHRADLFQTAPIGLCLMDPEGRPLDENRAWEKLTGGPRRALNELAGDAASSRFLLSCITNGRSEFSIQVESRRLRLFGKRLNQPDGAMPLVYVRGEDVTVEHALEMLMTHLAQNAPDEIPTAHNKNAEYDATHSPQFIALNRLQGRSETHSDVVALLSHEMRNPLHAIIGFSEIMLEAHFGPLGNSRYESYARDIKLSAERLLDLVTDLLDLARIEAGRLALDHEEISLQPLIAECVQRTQAEAGKYAVSLKSEISPELPALLADARSLRQVLLALLSNAIKFTGENGQIVISAHLDDGGALEL